MSKQKVRRNVGRLEYITGNIISEGFLITKYLNINCISVLYLPEWMLVHCQYQPLCILKGDKSYYFTVNCNSGINRIEKWLTIRKQRVFGGYMESFQIGNKCLVGYQKDQHFVNETQLLNGKDDGTQ